LLDFFACFFGFNGTDNSKIEFLILTIMCYFCTWVLTGKGFAFPVKHYALALVRRAPFDPQSDSIFVIMTGK